MVVVVVVLVGAVACGVVGRGDADGLGAGAALGAADGLGAGRDEKLDALRPPLELE